MYYWQVWCHKCYVTLCWRQSICYVHLPHCIHINYIESGKENIFYPSSIFFLECIHPNCCMELKVSSSVIILIGSPLITKLVLLYRHWSCPYEDTLRVALWSQNWVTQSDVQSHSCFSPMSAENCKMFLVWSSESISIIFSWNVKASLWNNETTHLQLSKINFTVFMIDYGSVLLPDEKNTVFLLYVRHNKSYVRDT